MKTAVLLLMFTLFASPSAADQADICSNATTTYTLSTASSATVGANSGRRYLSLYNASATAAEVVWCNARGGAAVSGQGIVVPAGAQQTFDAVVPVGAVACISASGTPALKVCEGN